MKRILSILLLSFSGLSYSQTEIFDKLISIEFNNIELKDAIIKLQNVSEVKFAFNTKIEGMQEKINGSFNGVSLETILDNILKDKNIAFKVVNFVTVNCCSGTAVRGEFLRKKFSAGCENMEGAAVAMVCKNFNIPCVELRSVSNMVKDRDTESWQLAEAIEKICMVAEVVLHEYVQGVSSHD